MYNTYMYNTYMYVCPSTFVLPSGAFCSPRRAFEMLLEHFLLPSHTPEMHARS